MERCVLLLLLAFAQLATCSISMHAPEPRRSRQGEIRSNKQPVYYSRLSKVPYTELPGGRYKETSTQDFPASTGVSGLLVELAPGGLREPHWHDPDEWAYVIRGTCRATLVDQGKQRPVESWDFTQGDIWYFPSNLGHTILGVASDSGDNCTYIAGYNDGSFRETLNARGLSGWLSTAPPEIVAQALGVSVEEIEANIKPDTDSFIALGNLGELTAGQGDPPLLAAQAATLRPPQLTTQMHRLPLYFGTIPEVNTAGGTIQVGDITELPASTGMSGAIVKMEPGALRQMHWHPLQDEWDFVINGTMKMGIYNGPGQLSEFDASTGDVSYAPRGSAHWILNTSQWEPLWLVLIFSAGKFTNVDVTNWVGAQPPAYAATSLGSPLNFTKSWDHSLAGIVARRGDD